MRLKTLTISAFAAALTLGCATAEKPMEPAKKAAAEKPAEPPAPELMMGASAAMLANTCAGCHGTDGASTGPAPSIAGLSVDYFTATMKAYQSGDRWSTIMDRIAKGYSDDEIAAMAKLYGSMKFPGVAQIKVDSMAQQGKKLHDEYCEKCHENEGREIEDDSGLLAGQWMPYVHWTIDDYVAGRSKSSEKKMQKALEKMLAGHGADSVKNLVHFYGSRK